MGTAQKATISYKNLKNDIKVGTTILIDDGLIEMTVEEIRGGEIRMTEADCPDQICVHTGWIDQEHDMIVCMPNKVVVQIVEQ